MSLPERPYAGAPRRVTMKDVADHCGVSLSTVSLVLSGDQRIPPATTQRVLEVVKALGYRPNVIARNLAKQRSRTLAVVLPDLGAVVDRSFFSEALTGVYSETSRQGYRLLLEIATPQFLSRRFYLRLLKENSADGIVYLGATLKDEFLKELEGFSYPFLLVGGYLDDVSLSYVAVDNEGGSYQATRHLLGLGHRAIGHLTGPQSFASARDRLTGYRRALEEAGVPFDPQLVVDGQYRADISRQATPALLEKGATAIFAGSDWMASGALQAIKESGRRVPQDVSLVGSGDLELARLVEPPLTTLNYDVVAMAAEGTRLLVERVERGGPANVFHKKYPAQLVTRQSTAPAPKR